MFTNFMPPYAIDPTHAHGACRVQGRPTLARSSTSTAECRWPQVRAYAYEITFIMSGPALRLVAHKLAPAATKLLIPALATGVCVASCSSRSPSRPRVLSADVPGIQKYPIRSDERTDPRLADEVAARSCDGGFGKNKSERVASAPAPCGKLCDAFGPQVLIIGGGRLTIASTRCHTQTGAPDPWPRVNDACLGLA